MRWSQFAVGKGRNEGRGKEERKEGIGTWNGLIFAMFGTD